MKPQLVWKTYRFAMHIVDCIAKLDAGITERSIVQLVAAQLPNLPKEFKGSLPTVEEIEKELGLAVKR
jgi:hypothetical protein